jgi:hypothetical protein
MESFIVLELVQIILLLCRSVLIQTVS